MSQKDQQAPSLTKKYSLTEDETSNIDSRQTKIKEFQYFIHIINADIQAYMNFVVCKRLSIPEGAKFSLSEDNKTLELHDSTKTE